MIKGIFIHLSKDREISINSRIFGSVLIVLSGLILFAEKVNIVIDIFEKVFNIESNNYYSFNDTQTFVWVLTQSLSPLIMAFSSSLKPFKFSYAVPIYIYTIQLCWIFNAELNIDDYLLQFYAIGTTITFLFFIYLTQKVKIFYDKQAIENKRFREESLKEIKTLRKIVLSK